MGRFAERVHQDSEMQRTVSVSVLGEAALMVPPEPGLGFRSGRIWMHYNDPNDPHAIRRGYFEYNLYSHGPTLETGFMSATNPNGVEYMTHMAQMLRIGSLVNKTQMYYYAPENGLLLNAEQSVALAEYVSECFDN